MNNKKVQANMQVNVSFIGTTQKLVKQLETDVSKLNFSSTLGNKFGTELQKNFKVVNADLNKMIEGLSKKGLSSKQYTQFFNSMHEKLIQSIQFTKKLEESYSTMFNSPENKKALKELDELKKKLEEINKLSSSQKSASTRQQTAIKKMKDETGIDYEANKDILGEISKRKQSKRNLTKTQDDWLAANGLTEEKLKRVLELLRQINSQTSKINNLNEQSKTKYNGTVPAAQKATQKAIENKQNSVITEDLYNQNKPILDNISKGGEFLEVGANELLPKFTNEMSLAEKEAEKLAKAGMTIKEILGQFGIIFSAAAIVRNFQDLTRSAFEFYKSLDSALNEIYVVSNLTINSVNGLKSNFINMAKETGMAIDDVTRAAVLFYQQGLNTNEVLVMTEVTSQFAKVAGIDATDAADKLTAAVNGYCLAAEDAINVADKFNKVAAASAADINELSTAFSKAAAQANQAGVSMDNYLAYIATMEEATREAPENIGTSLKTIFSRMQQVKESGTTEDKETDVNQVETALKSVGIALRDTKGELRDLEEVFDELGPKWNSLDRNTQAYLGTIIAGTRQQSRFITLMQNWDRVLDLADQSANSAGMQALMHEKAMDSITSKMEQFQVAWQEFISNLTSSNVIKGLISGLTSLLKVFNGGNKPITLMATAIGLLSTKLKDLQDPIKNKVKDWTEVIKKIGSGSLVSNSEKKQKVKDNKQAQEDQQGVVKQRQNDLENLQAELSAKATLNAEDKEALANSEYRLQLEKQRLETLREEGVELKNQTSKKEAVGKGLIAAGTIAQTTGLLASQKDENLGGAISSAGSVMTAVGQFATGNWIGGIMSAATSIYQISQTIENWDDNIKARIENSINQVNDALTNYNNNATGIKSADSLIKKYDTLSKKLYKTETEQKELNDTIQQLSDTYGVDAITDAYGNLSISIAEVNKLLDEQKAKQEEALKEIDKTERESLKTGISGLGNDTTVSEYTTKLFTQSRSQYKNLLSGVEDGLTDESRSVSKNVAEAFASNLKTNLVDYIQENADEFIVKGFSKGLIGLEKEINETLGKSANSAAWNDLYSSIDFLQNNIDNMTFAQAQEYLDKYFNKWHEKIGLTLEQWNILKDSINNTVFGEGPMLQFFEKVGDLEEKGSTDYWENKEGTGKLDRLKEEMKEAIKDYQDSVSWANKINQFSDFAEFDNDDIDGIMNKIIELGEFSPDNWGADLFRFKEGDQAADTLSGVVKAYQEAQEEMEEFYQKFAEENNLDNRFEAEKYINALITVKNAMADANSGTVEYLNSLETLYNTEGMSGAAMEQYAESIKQVMNGLNLMDINATDADKYNYLARYYEANKDNMAADVRKQWEDTLEEAFEDLNVSTPRTLKEIGNELQSISSDLVNMNDIIQDFTDNGGLALDTFIELADIIDSINLDDLGKLDPSAVDAYIKSIDNLNLAYDANTGYITMNAASVATLQDIQELQVKSKIAGMINELKASKATTETQLAYIDAQIAATDAAIKVAQMDSESTVTGDQIKMAANSAFTTEFDKSMAAVTGSYENDATNQGQWSTTILSNLGTVADAWSKYFTGIANGSVTSLDEVKNTANNILKDINMKWEGAGNYSGIDWSKYDNITKGSEKQQQLINDLTAYRTKLENTRKSYQATLDLTNQEINLLQNMYDSDLSNLKGSSSKDSSKKIETYIGQLKEIYNILNRIQMLEHRLSTLDTYADISVGKQYGDLLQQRLGYNEELLDQYSFLVSEQKQFTNGYKDFIGTVDGLEGVFDFDQYGQIIINWEKYIALQDTAIDGEVTLKQKADDVYETYTSMFDELKSDFDNYIKYLKQVIDLQQEMIDSYVSTQNKAADAIKEIYQKILDTKLDAIDQEKEAIEELRKAREQARKDQENAKTVSGLQTNLQRAMMDTSGASDISLIKAQQDLDDKLSDIAEDKYSQMLDDIIDQLDEEQEALQDNFDMLFEDMEWLFEYLDEEMMLDEERLSTLLQQTDEWATSSELQRRQLMEEWMTDYHTYVEGLKGNKTIYDVWDELGENRKRIGELDTSLVNEMSKESKEIIQTIKSWQTDVNSTINSAVNKATSYYSGGGGGNKTPGGSTINSGDNNGPDVSQLSKTTEENINYKYDIGNKVKIHTNGILPGKSPNYYDAKGVKKGESMFEKKGAIVERINIPGMGNLYRMEGLQYFYKESDLFKYKFGGLADFTGPAWLDGTKTRPEAVLNSLQTEHFINFTNALDKLTSGKYNTTSTNSSIAVGDITFQVESMSSAEDGEKAFNMFVDKFKEIGNRTGIKVDSFKNTL